MDVLGQFTDVKELFRQQMYCGNTSTIILGVKSSQELQQMTLHLMGTAPVIPHSCSPRGDEALLYQQDLACIALFVSEMDSRKWCFTSWH